MTTSRLSSFFPTYFGLHQNTDLIFDLRDYILSNAPKGIASECAPQIKKNLVESDFSFFKDPHHSVQQCAQFFSRCLTETLNDIHKEKVKYKIVFNESWFHIGSKYSVHDVHMHAGCSWCGIFYVQSGDQQSGETIFVNPLTQQYSDFGNRYLMNNYNIRITPKDGYLVLFPSYLHHYQSLYTGNKPRIVVSFNCSVHA